MPIPIPPSTPAGAPPDAPPGGNQALPPVRQHDHYYLRERQNWATEQERMRHNEALYHIGEWIMLILIWDQLDFRAGLVGRCSRCTGSTGSKTARISAVYEQPRQNECPVCFGTTFEGGYRARIIRPGMITDVEETEKQGKRGSEHPAQVSVQTTSDFRSRPGDFMIRADGSRWRLSEAQRLQVRTGHLHPSAIDEGTSYMLRASAEETGSVAWTLPPDTITARAVLSRPMQLPGQFDWAAYEQIRGPLTPQGMIS